MLDTVHLFANGWTKRLIETSFVAQKFSWALHFVYGDTVDILYIKKQTMYPNLIFKFGENFSNLWKKLELFLWGNVTGRLGAVINERNDFVTHS